MDGPHGARLEQEYMEGEMVMKTASIKSRKKAMASSSRLPVRRECERLEGVKAWRRPDMRQHRRWQVCRFGPQNRTSAGFSVWASKLGGDESEDAWHRRKACIETKRSREGARSIRYSEKYLDGLTLKWYLSCILHVRTFWSFGQRLYICGGGCCGRPTSLHLFWWRLSHLFCERDLGLKRGIVEWLFV